MQISFFEEFPTRKNLEKINLVNWPTKLYIAAKNLGQFNKIKSEIENKNIKELVYWPICDIHEGYWISPFTKRSALKRIFNELKNTKTSVMLDLELPTTKNPRNYITQFQNFPINKSLIKKFIKEHVGNVYLAEYYPEGKRKEKVLQFLGLHYKNKKAKIIKMLYHSLHHFNREFITQELKRGKEEFGENYLIALGIIAPGANGNEPLLPPEQLQQDLQLAREAGIKEVIIFRLGGLDKEYIKVINSYR
ncbi:hypothetical protein HZC32_02780 [Candidatus Woesearchaeota archaeon]|nr:hypothetical protein [Candidatus Woesearchaeota archaeon]